MKKALLLTMSLLLAACQAGVGGSQEAPDVTEGEDPVPRTSFQQESAVVDNSTFDGPVRSVAIDTDMSVDDLIAIAMLANSPAIEVKSITITGLFVRCPAGEDIMLDFLATIGASGISVACGATEALEGGRAFPDDWRDLADQGWGASLTPSLDTPDSRGGVSLLADTIAQGLDALVVLGPATSSATVFRDNPEMVSKVSEIVMMAGAVDVAGNLYLDGNDQPPWPGEWNVYVDPTATQELFSSGVPVVMVGLDATNDVPVTRDVVDRMRQEGSGLAVNFAVTTLERLRLVETFDSYFWDQLAVSYLLNPEVVTLEQTAIKVVTSSGKDAGRTLRDPSGSVISVATGANPDLFYQLMVDSLSGRAP